MHAAGAPHHLSLKVILKCLVFWVEHCLKQTFRGELRRKMWTILPRAVSGVRKKTAVWSKQSVRTIYNSEQYILAWLSGCGPFKICLTWCDLFKCPQSNFKSRCKSKLQARQMTKVTLTWAECHALSTWSSSSGRSWRWTSQPVCFDGLYCVLKPYWPRSPRPNGHTVQLKEISLFSTHLYLPLCFSKAYTTQ